MTQSAGAHPSPSEREAEDAFVQYVVLHEEGERIDPAEYCRRFPSVERELGDMLAVWQRVRGAADAPEHSGGAVSSTIDDAYAREVVARLGARAAAHARYEQRGEIARGGMGIVRRVWDTDLRRELAMKVIRERDGSGSGSSSRPLARFLEEAQVTAQLDHPGVVPIHEVGLDDEGHVYFTMKLVKGRTLASTIEHVHAGSKGWTLARAVRVLLKICEAMAYAHSKGVVHRDLKPSNVMVGRFGEVYVMDWGLARVVADEGGAARPAPIERSAPDLTSDVRTERRERARDAAEQILTLDGNVVGTPAYMSPEQARGNQSEVGPCSDVYAVGAILYELLSGETPYLRPGVVASKHTVWRWVQEGPPAPLAQVAPDAPPELIATCERAMAREPAERYPDMGALATDLEAYLEGRVVTAYEGGAVAELRKWVRRNRPLAAALAAAVLLLTVGLASTTGLFLRSEARARDVLRLSAIQILRGLELRAAALWPATPERVPDYERWLADAKLLSPDIDEHRRVLAQLRTDAGPWTALEQERDSESHPRAAELASERTELERWEHSTRRIIEGPESEKYNAETREHLRGQLERQRAVVAELEDEVAVRRTWTLANPREQWWHDQIAGFLSDLEAFEDPETGLHAEMRRRLEFARDVDERSVSGPEARERWAEAISSISDPSKCPRYASLSVRPQMGLLPLWHDEHSGLWEFAHLQTGSPPERTAEGEVALDEETGLVFVLLPGGTYRQGAQADEPDQPNYDPEAISQEGPPRRVTLEPFFASKYEMTQSQWERVTGSNPSTYFAGFYVFGSKDVITGLHPVENVDWRSCDEVVRRLDLALPSEAQWEYLARGETTTAWWSGDEPEGIGASANLCDVRGQQAGATRRGVPGYLDNDDGYPIHAPVGTFDPNPFGLHHVIGNVNEWCADGYALLNQPIQAGDGAARGADLRFRMTRGGSYRDSPLWARSSARGIQAPNVRLMNIGFRPVRALRP